jgi:hypothetical protein
MAMEPHFVKDGAYHLTVWFHRNCAAEKLKLKMGKQNLKAQTKMYPKR